MRLYDLYLQEKERQQKTISLIASENYVSREVMRFMGGILTNKYAEGSPSKRYYAGCSLIDRIEEETQALAKSLFKAKHAFVQCHSGSQANQAVFHALLKPQDTILSLSLRSGGHLTHGSPFNQSGRLYNIVSYDLDDRGLLDYDRIAELASQHRPKLIIAGYTMFSFLIDWKKLRAIADTTDAYLLADISHISGLVAAGVYSSPIDAAHVVSSSTHKTLRGPRGGFILTNEDTLARQLAKGVFPGIQGGPDMNRVAAIGQALYEASTEEFCIYSKQIVLNARAMVATFLGRQLRVVSSEHHNHMLCLRLEDMNGLTAQNLLEANNIITNRNCIPNDPRSPYYTSGLRLGTAAITTRGMQEPEAVFLAECISDLLQNKKVDVFSKIENLASRYPIPSDRSW